MCAVRARSAAQKLALAKAVRPPILRLLPCSAVHGARAPRVFFVLVFFVPPMAGCDGRWYVVARLF